MSDRDKGDKRESGSILDKVLENLGDQLHRLGIDIESASDADGDPLKVVVVAPGLKKTLRAVSKGPRDQVVMVRVDEETSRTLDEWVATGAVKSRSEAAAVFIREGLQVRDSELEQLRSALDDVEAAKEKLHRRAKEVFGDGEAERGPDPGPDAD